MQEEAVRELLNGILNDAEHAMIHGEHYTLREFSDTIADIYKMAEAALRRVEDTQ